MLYLKACPRCHGDMISSQTDPGERVCLQCGYIAYPAPPLPFVSERRPTARGKRPKVRRAA